MLSSEWPSTHPNTYALQINAWNEARIRTERKQRGASDRVIETEKRLPKIVLNRKDCKKRFKTNNLLCFCHRIQ